MNGTLGSSIGLAFSWCAWALLGVGCSEVDRGRRHYPPNLLIVTIDTLRHDALGCCGGAEGQTPNLDAFAESAAVFLRAYAPIATTFPSHASMFTGVYPRQHGVRWNGHSLGEDWVTLAEILEATGYRTAAFVGYKAMVNRGGLGQGFQTVSDPVHEKWDGARPGNETVAMALEWLDRGNSSPFFLWVHLFEPHSPYPVTPYARERMTSYSGILSDGATVEDLSALEDVWETHPEERRILRALYDGRVGEADAHVGRLMRFLDESALREKTVVAIVGDHGQLLGEHGTAGHGPVLWEEVLRTPLLIFDPEGSVGGLRVDERVGLIDLMPTVLDLIGVPVPGGLPGRSLKNAVRGGQLGVHFYLAEIRVKGDASTSGGSTVERSSVAALKGRYKLVAHPRRAELFDLQTDPDESNPLAPRDRPEVAEELAFLALSHRDSEAQSGDREIDAETRMELEALGYLR